MHAPDLLVACDFGTTRFRVLISEPTDDGGLHVVARASVPSDGYRDGDFVDLRSAGRAISAAVGQVEAAADIDINAFYYNIAGSHLRSVWSRGQVRIDGGPRPIDAGDLDAVMTKARSLVIPFDHWILAVNPVDYAVDRRRGIDDPVGRIGRQLEVEWG